MNGWMLLWVALTDCLSTDGLSDSLTKGRNARLTAGMHCGLQCALLHHTALHPTVAPALSSSALQSTDGSPLTATTRQAG